MTQRKWATNLGSLVMLMLLGIVLAMLGGCGTMQPVNTGQQAGQPNARNANTQGNYIEQMTINITLPEGSATAPPLTIVGAPALTISGPNRIDITSQPANSGGSEGGAVASGNQIPIPVGGSTVTTPTQTVTPSTSAGGGAITTPTATTGKSDTSTTGDASTSQ